jgi:hypothetical protein
MRLFADNALRSVATPHSVISINPLFRSVRGSSSAATLLTASNAQHQGHSGPGNCAAGCNAAALNFHDNWRDVLREAAFVPAAPRRRTSESRNRAVTPVTMSLQKPQSTRKQSLTIVPSVAQRLILLAGRTGCRHCSRASSARAGSSVSIRRLHCAHRLRRNCRRVG